MIIFAPTKFGLVRIQGSGVKRGRNPPPRSERVFQIPVQIGLRCLFVENDGNGDKSHVNQK